MNLEEVSIGISIIALLVSFVAVLYIRGKYKLTKKDVDINEQSLQQQKYDSWLKEISPEPHVNIWDGKVEGITISANIANVSGYANEPKWGWHLNFKNGKTIVGKLTDDGISLKCPGGRREKISYIPPESVTFHLKSEVLELKTLNGLEIIDSLEIWVNYDGKKNTTYNSYKIFKYRNGKWTDENKRTKIWRVTNDNL